MIEMNVNRKRVSSFPKPEVVLIKFKNKKKNKTKQNKTVITYTVTFHHFLIQVLFSKKEW